MINKIPAVKAKSLLITTLNQAKKDSYQKFVIQFSQKPSFYQKIINKFKITAWLGSLVLTWLKANLSFFTNHYKKYKVSPNEKFRALDYCSYIIKKNPLLPYSFFKKKDWPKIKQFIKNIVLLACFDTIDKNKLFDKKSRQRQKIYQKFQKQKKSIGFKTVINYFDEAVFVENYGLPYLKNKKNFTKTIIDGGAFFGDTTFMFNQKLKPKKIVAIEPDPTNFKNLLKNIAINKLNNILALQRGLADFNGQLPFGITGSAAAHLSANAKLCFKAKVSTIDSIVKEFQLSQISLIKLDVEGYELESIIGAEKTIKKFKPALIVALYHQGRDLFEIPPLLKKFVFGYQFRFAVLRADSPTFERILVGQYES